MGSRLATLLLRPSTAFRAFWLGVALLHFAILAQRLISGEWRGAEGTARLVLLVVATVYGTVASWRPARALDVSPARLVGFLTLVALAHCAFTSAAYGRAAREFALEAPWGQAAAAAPLLAMAAAGMAMVLGAAGRSSSQRRRATGFGFRMRSEAAPIRVRPDAVQFQRPPPARFR